MLRDSIVWLWQFRTRPKPIVICTVLTVLSGAWWATFSVGGFARLGMTFFEFVGLPMQIGVIGMGIYVMVRLQRNRPESLIASVPIPVRIIVPLAVVLGALQLSRMPTSFPATSPAGNAVHSYDAGISNGVCTASFNGTERVVESLTYCDNYQTRFNRTFAAAWLLFSALELWGAWAVYGAEPVQRVLPDRKLLPSAMMGEPITAERGVRPKNPYLWLTVRIGILAYWAVAGWDGFKDNNSVPVFIPIFFLLVATLATRYSIIQAYTSTKRTEPWLLPSWFLNPFQMSQPFQFFHLGGLGFLLFGSAGMIRALADGKPFTLQQWPVEAFAGAFGLGILLGIYWAIAAYRSRFQRIAMP